MWRIWVSSQSCKTNLALHTQEFTEASLCTKAFIYVKVYFSPNRDQVDPSCPFEKEYRVTPLLANNTEKLGVALDGKLKDEDTNLASSTM